MIKKEMVGRWQKPADLWLAPNSASSVLTNRLKSIIKTRNFCGDFVTEEGKIRPRRQTGSCAKHQRLIASAAKTCTPYCITSLHW